MTNIFDIVNIADTKVLPLLKGLFYFKNMSTDQLKTNAQDYSARFANSSKMPKLSKPNINLSGIKEKIKHVKKTHLYIGGFLVLLVVAFVIGRQFSPQSSLGAISNGDQRQEAPAPIATQGLNKEFKFPLLDEEGEELAKITYYVESANLQDSFIYQGSRATAVKGRTFLIFNLKITNPYDKAIEVNARDYMRIKMNGSEEQLAPEIHNDPVEIQANSTKYARIGLPINETDKDIILLIGELNGDKETVKLNLSR